MKFSFYILLFLISFSCNQKTEVHIDHHLSDKYQQDIANYREDLLQSRRQNYLPLIGLMKMDSAFMTFGNNEDNYLKIKSAAMPNMLGVFKKNDSIFSFSVAEALKVKTELDSIITHQKLPFNEFGSSTKMSYNSLTWQIITRNEQPYLRVWDTENSEILAFKGFEHYSLNPDFIIAAMFSHYENEKSEEVDSQLGPKASTSFIGQVSFKFQEKNYQLDVGADGFTMVNDESTGNETYGGGRYIYLDLPEKDGSLQIDFNKLYNPPCAFNKFTTCLYPPRQNYLPFKIEAGEKIKRL